MCKEDKLVPILGMCGYMIKKQQACRARFHQMSQMPKSIEKNLFNFKIKNTQNFTVKQVNLLTKPTRLLGQPKSYNQPLKLLLRIPKTQNLKMFPLIFYLYCLLNNF